jgi:hypothetical protein
MDFSFSLPPPAVAISVHLNNRPWRSLSVDRCTTVLSLKELISPACGLHPSQQRLVFAGQVLADEMSLDFYRIASGARVYLLPHPRPREDARALLRRLTALLSEAGAGGRGAALAEIEALVGNRRLQALSRIDASAKGALAEAAALVGGPGRAPPARAGDVRARAQDQALTQYEASPEGFRALASLLESEGSPDEDGGFDETEIRPAMRICERPLPNPWKEKGGALYASALRLSFGSRDAPRRSPAIAHARFSRQVAALKEMGFSDEDGILRALCETNGNVQLAAERLRASNR